MISVIKPLIYITIASFLVLSFMYLLYVTNNLATSKAISKALVVLGLL